MCYSNCPYENSWGECKGPSKMSTSKPHCYATEEWKQYLESCDEDKVEQYEYTRQEGSDN